MGYQSINVVQMKRPATVVAGKFVVYLLPAPHDRSRGALGFRDIGSPHNPSLDPHP